MLGDDHARAPGVSAPGGVAALQAVRGESRNGYPGPREYRPHAAALAAERAAAARLAAVRAGIAARLDFGELTQLPNYGCCTCCPREPHGYHDEPHPARCPAP